MSEEKKAIELTKTIIEFAGENRKALQVLLNLIETQQKEKKRAALFIFILHIFFYYLHK